MNIDKKAELVRFLRHYAIGFGHLGCCDDIPTLFDMTTGIALIDLTDDLPYFYDGEKE